MKRGRLRDAHAPRGELSAGGVDVATARAAHKGLDALRFEYRLERLYALFGRGPVRQLVRGVVRNQVHLRAEFVPVEKACQLPRVLVRVVYTVEHHVLEREALA